jgi:hypothetical protein
MRLRFLFTGIVSILLAGCGTPPLKLIAHEGPMAQANPDLVIPAVTHGQGNIGTLAFEYPNSSCNGKWERISHRVAEGLFRDMGDVTHHGGVVGMGEGNTVLHGDSKAQIVGAGDCSDGTTFVFFSVANGFKARGALKDSNGNMFVMMLR